MVFVHPLANAFEFCQIPGVISSLLSRMLGTRNTMKYPAICKRNLHITMGCTCTLLFAVIFVCFCLSFNPGHDMYDLQICVSKCVVHAIMNQLNLKQSFKTQTRAHMGETVQYLVGCANATAWAMAEVLQKFVYFSVAFLHTLTTPFMTLAE